MKENKAVHQMFLNISTELDEKNDRYERIVKISRDITIESKKIIFLLHTVDSKKQNSEKVCKEARTRLLKLVDTKFFLIAKELHGLDQHQFIRAFTFGLQEFIEAFTYLGYIEANEIQNLAEVKELLAFRDKQESHPEGGTKEFSCILPPMDYVLGLADLTGEVMRRCVSSLGNGDEPECHKALETLRNIYSGFMSCHAKVHQNRDFEFKETTMKQSLLKCENICYTAHLRKCF